jgi:hypothetical protein
VREGVRGGEVREANSFIILQFGPGEDDPSNHPQEVDLSQAGVMKETQAKSVESRDHDPPLEIRDDPIDGPLGEQEEQEAPRDLREDAESLPHGLVGQELNTPFGED